jgi:hypothetical protein
MAVGSTRFSSMETRKPFRLGTQTGVSATMFPSSVARSLVPLLGRRVSAVGTLDSDGAAAVPKEVEAKGAEGGTVGTSGTLAEGWLGSGRAGPRRLVVAGETPGLPSLSLPLSGILAGGEGTTTLGTVGPGSRPLPPTVSGTFGVGRRGTGTEDATLFPLPTPALTWTPIPALTVALVKATLRTLAAGRPVVGRLALVAGKFAPTLGGGTPGNWTLGAATDGI